jgi:hypothetical protein
MVEADDRDREHVAEIMAALDADPRPRVGDFIRFKDGAILRIAILERWDGPDSWSLLQPARSGRWYLGTGGADYSGGPASGLPRGTVLTDSGERRTGSVWVFHHGLRGNGRGVDLDASWRIYDCPLSTCITPDREHNWHSGTPQYTKAGTLYGVTGVVACSFCHRERNVEDLTDDEQHAVYKRVAREHVGRIICGSDVGEARPMSDEFAQWALIAYGVNMTGKPTRSRKNTAERRAPGDMWLTVTVGPTDPEIDDQQRLVTAEQLARLPEPDPRLSL